MLCHYTEDFQTFGCIDEIDSSDDDDGDDGGNLSIYL